MTINKLYQNDVEEQYAVKKKKVYQIWRTIFRIFIIFSTVVMFINMILLMFGLCFFRLLTIINEGARPPTLLNIGIMAETGAAISLDSLSQSHNDLLIAKGFSERIIRDYYADNLPITNIDEASFTASEISEETLKFGAVPSFSPIVLDVSYPEREPAINTFYTRTDVTSTN